MSVIAIPTQEATTAPPVVEAPELTTGKKSGDERKRALAQAAQNFVVQDYRIESQASEYATVLVEGQRVNHVLHLILSILTVGAWLLVWAALVLLGGEKRVMISVDEFGNVLTQKLVAP